jgi:hypothetical protein
LLAVTKCQCPPDFPGDRNRSAGEIASPTGCPKGKRSAAMSPHLEPGEAGHSCPAYFCRQFQSTLPHLSAQGRTGLQARSPLPDRCKNGPGDPFYFLLPVTECQWPGLAGRQECPTLFGQPFPSTLPHLPPEVERVSRPVPRCRTDAKTGLETRSTVCYRSLNASAAGLAGRQECPALFGQPFPSAPPPISPPKVERVSRPVSRCRTNAKTGLETPFYIDSAVMAGIRGTIEYPSPTVATWTSPLRWVTGDRTIDRSIEPISPAYTKKGRVLRPALLRLDISSAPGKNPGPLPV